MPWTIWRYTFFELLRLVLLSTAVLVTVIAFAAAVKPLAEGELDPIDTVKFMLFAIPPMLAYALPFAAGFGTTLAYHRMAQDNEVIAAHSGGVSHRSLLVPALVSGILLAGCLAMLNEQVIPRFLQQMERMVTRDLAQILIRKIERGESATLENTTIYADRVRRVEPEPGSPVLDMLLLESAAVIEVNDKGEIDADAVADSVWVLIYPGHLEGFGSDSLAGKVVFENAVGVNKGQRIEVERAASDPFRIPDAFEDDPKFLTFGELASLRENPEQMNFIETRRIALARRLAARDTVRQIAIDLESQGYAMLVGPAGGDVAIRAAGIEAAGAGLKLLPSGGSVEVEWRRPPNAAGDRAIRFFRARSAVLELDFAPAPSASPLSNQPVGPQGVRLDLLLTGVETRAAGSDLWSERPEDRLDDLTLRSDPMVVYHPLSAAAVAGEAEAAIEANPPNPGYGIVPLREDLVFRLDKLAREITSKQHERWAMAASCLVMVLTGAVMALKLKDAVPLVVYLWSFFPALATVILISSGQQHAHGENIITGLPILWSGVVALAIYAAVNLAILSRH